MQTQSPLVYVHVELKAGASTAIPDGYSERAAFVAAGTVRVGQDSYEAGQMVVFARDSKPRRCVTDATVMLLGGEPLGTRDIWWNFVSSRPERIEQAKADWRAGQFPCRSATPTNSFRCRRNRRRRRNRCPEVSTRGFAPENRVFFASRRLLGLRCRRAATAGIAGAGR